MTMNKLMNKIKVAAFIALIPAMLISCGEKPQEKAGPVKKIAPKPPSEAMPASPIDISAQIESTVRAKKRNPFMNYVVAAKGSERTKVKGPLECCEAGAFKLLAVVNSPDNAFALIQAPDNKRYIVRRGDVIGTKEGKIVKFGPRSITVREAVPDEAGRPPIMVDTELKLPLEAESKK